MITVNKLTRERVRQIEKTFLKKTLLNHGSLISVWKNNLKSRIEILVSPASLKFVESISGYSNSLKNIGQLKLIFKHLFEDEFFIITFEDDPYVSRVKQEEFDKYTDQLKASIKSQIGTSIQNIEISCKASCPPLLSEFFPYLFTKIKNENMVISGNSDEKVLRSYHDRRNSVSYALETVIDQINQEISNQELKSIQKSLFPDIDWRSFQVVSLKLMVFIHSHTELGVRLKI